MKRDWDVIRELLIEIEEFSTSEREEALYGRGRQDETRAAHVFLLWEAGYLKGINAASLAGPALMSPTLTWSGHELLATLRSRSVWDRIKAMAQEKGIELTFDGVTALAKVVLDVIARA